MTARIGEDGVALLWVAADAVEDNYKQRYLARSFFFF